MPSPSALGMRDGTPYFDSQPPIIQHAATDGGASTGAHAGPSVVHSLRRIHVFDLCLN